MADRYYLIDLGASPATQATRIQTIRDGVPDRIGRTRAHQKLHWRPSLSGRWLMAQADTDDAEHTAMLARSWVTAGGTAAEARAAIQANAAEWEPTRGLS